MSSIRVLGLQCQNPKVAITNIDIVFFWLCLNFDFFSGGARQHYLGSRHAKGVTRAVEHLPRGARPWRLVDGPSITPTLTSSVVEEAKKAWSLKPKEYEPPVDEQEKERRARFRVSRGQIHHYNKDSRRLDFWI